MPTATITPPADLVELRVAWLAAEAAHKRACDETNAGPEITTAVRESAYAVSAAEKWVRTTYYPTEGQLERRAETYSQLLGATRAVRDHAWWDTLEPGTKGAAEIEVRRLARERFEQQVLAAA